MTTYIIAELGQNHNGSMDEAKSLIDAAALANVNAVKSQKRDVWESPDPSWATKPYENSNSYGATYLEHRRALELSVDQHAELAAYARDYGIDYGLSCWDAVSAKQVVDAGFCSWLKVASATVTNRDVLGIYAESGLPVIMSVGMSTVREIEDAVDVFDRCDLTILHCTSAYPCPPEEANLSRIETLRSMYPHHTIGVSGHWNGIALDVAAVALGAKVIERHFTMDRTQKGTDHKASLEPQGLTKLVRDVRLAEIGMGTPTLGVRPCEEEARKKLRGAA